MSAMRAQASVIYVGVITIVASLGTVFVSSTNQTHYNNIIIIILLVSNCQLHYITYYYYYA